MNKFLQIFKIKDLRNKILIVAFLLLSFTFLANIANAEETLDFPLAFEMPGTIEGINTHFKITNSEYLNIILDSSESIKLRMESIPEMLTIMIESSSSTLVSTTSTKITLSGFTPLTTYYKYQDDYHNLTEFITDENGSYIYFQDLSKPHFVFIQPRKSTKFIKDDATGGDCYLIGNWNWVGKTCALTTDLNETIQIDNNNITLDGDNHIITGSNTGYGVYLNTKTGIFIKNFNIKKFNYGIFLFKSSTNTLKNNITSNNHYGIVVHPYSVSNIIQDNISNFNNSNGITLSNGSNFNIIANNITDSNGSGIAVFSSKENQILNNTIENNNHAGIGLNSANNNTIVNNNIRFNNWGIGIGYSRNNKTYNNNFIDNQKQVGSYWSNSGNVFNLSLPIGGNFWSNFDTLAEGCNDLNNDKICDSSYIFSSEYGYGTIYNIYDYYPWIKQSGWKPNQPPTIANLNQYKSDGTTIINEGGITTEDIIVFKATLNDPDNDQIKLQIELKEFNQSFDGTNLLESDFVSSGSEAVVNRQSLIDGSYKWRTRAVDNKSNVSQWQEFGAAGNVDFEVKLPLSLKAAKLTKLVIDAPYLGDGDTYGGKGWDIKRVEYVNKDLIFNGYNFWNNKLKQIAFGAGLDCSGLTQWAYNYSFDPKKSLLRNVIRYDGADGQYKNNTETLAENDLKPGDLLFLDQDNDNFMDHVAMYTGNFVINGGTFDIVEAYSPRTGIVPADKSEFKSRIGFDQNKHIRRVVPSPSIGGQVKAGSPIDLAVTDPDGFTITPITAIQTDNEYLREIPGELYYTENVLGVDGRPEDIVYWPKQKTGDYIIKVLPEAGVAPTETYSLEFIVGEQTAVLTDNIPLSQIPSDGYGINITDSGIISTFMPVAIDIKLGSYPNSINLGSKGVVPVAILGSNTFDVHQINLSSVTLADATIKFKKNGQLMVSYEDVNGDGFVDVVVHIATKDLQLTLTDIKAELNGLLIDGRKIKGSDLVRIVP